MDKKLNPKLRMVNFKLKKRYSKQHCSQATNGGFSLIETLVAVTILLLAVAGPLTIAHRALSDANLVKNQITAGFLAQEAVEYVRNIRDENNIKGISWTNTLSDCEGVNCIVDVANDSTNTCGECNDPLHYNSVSGLYSYNSNLPPTIFYRTLSIDILNDAEFLLTVNVSWQNGKISKTLTLRNTILNWHGEDACVGCI